jgi:hypothetical protein
MSKGFTYIVPTNLERELTGFICAGEKEIRGQQWRVEFHSGRAPALTRNGIAVAWEAATNEARKFVHAVADFYRSSASLSA